MHQPQHLNRGIFVALVTSLIFSLYPNFTRLAYENGVNASFILIVGAWMRALFSLAIVAAKRIKIFTNRKTTRESIIGGLYQTISNITMTLALIYLPGPIFIVILFTHSIMLLLYMGWTGEIVLTRITLLSTIVALLGLCFVVNVFSTHAAFNPLGLLLAFACAIIIASRMYRYQHQMHNRNPFAVAAENTLFTAIFCTLYILFVPPVAPHNFAGTLGAFSAGFTLSLGSILVFLGISLIGSFQWSLYSKAEPIFTALFAYFILNEVLSTTQYFGMAITVASLIIYQIGTHRKNRKKSIHPTTQLK